MGGTKTVDLELEAPWRSLASGLKLGLGSGKTTLELNHKAPSNSYGLELYNSKWGVSYDAPSKDIAIDYKRTIKQGELKIKQRIPNKQFFLVPSPEIKLVTNPVVKSKFRHEAEVSYDFQRRVGEVEEEVTFDSKYRVKLTADTLTRSRGLTLALNAKLGKSWASSVGVSASKSAGPVLKHEADIKKGTLRAKTEIKLKSKEAKVELQPKPINKLRLTLTATARLDKATVPSFTLGAKYDL